MPRPARLLSALAFVTLTAGLCAARADDIDTLKQKLDESKKGYADEWGKFKQAVTDWLDKREETVRKTGNKALIEQVKYEREAFEKRGEPPAGLPAATRQKMVAVRSKLDKAYTATVKELL